MRTRASLLLTALLLAPLAVLHAADLEKQKPNSLIVINNDQNWQECSEYVNTWDSMSTSGKQRDQ